MSVQMNSKNNNIGTFKIAATYIGTVVGAGFASGQEVLQFFIAFGVYGFLGILLSTFIFFFIGYNVLVIGKKLNVDSYDDIILYTNGKIIGRIIDIIIIIFLFGALAAMIAGSGAIIHEQFDISPIWGTILMTLITLLTVITGTRGVINAISYVVPVLLISVLFISLYSIIFNPITSEEFQYAASLTGATPNWFISAINYASYNLIIAVAVLGPLGTLAKDKRTLFNGALFGALGLGIGVITIYYSIITNIKEVSGYEVPMILIASNISRIIQIVFSIVLVAEVYTTAVGNLYGFVSRIAFIGKEFRVLAITLTSILAFLVAQVGFSSMVKYLYPSVGYGGILMLIGITIWFFKRKK